MEDNKLIFKFSNLGENGGSMKLLIPPQKSFEEEIGTVDPLFKDFILKCLK